MNIFIVFIHGNISTHVYITIYFHPLQSSSKNNRIDMGELHENIDLGKIKLHLDEIRKKKNISINKLACRAEMQRSQVRSYCNNTVQRLDMAVLARLCYALECDVTDIVEYIPPKTAQDTKDTR